MFEQPTFWDASGAIVVDRPTPATTLSPAKTFSNTRKLAYQSSEKLRAGMAAIVLEFIRSRGEHGAIDEEIEELAESLGKRGSTGRCRRVDLARAGRIVDSGRRRKTKTGHQAIVWIAAGS